VVIPFNGKIGVILSEGEIIQHYFLYTNGFKVGNLARRRPEFKPDEVGAKAAQLE
jgi:hypothetical protein